MLFSVLGGRDSPQWKKMMIDVNVVVGDEKVEDVLVADIVSVGVIVEEVGTF